MIEGTPQGRPDPGTPRSVNDLQEITPIEVPDPPEPPKIDQGELDRLESRLNEVYGSAMGGPTSPAARTDTNFEGNQSAPGKMKETTLASLTGGAASPTMIQGWTDLISLVEEVKDELIKANAALLAIVNKEG